MTSPLLRAVPALALVCSCASGRPLPVDTAGMLGRAQADLASGRIEDATKEFEEVLEREPGSFPALRGRVEAARLRNDLARVADDAQAATRARPADAAAFYALGLARFAQGDGAAAAVALGRASDLAPGEGDVHYRLGLVLLDRQDLAEAHLRLARSVELAPAAVRHRIALAVCLGRLGDRDAALGALRQIPKLQPSPDEAMLAVKASRDLSDPFREVPPEARRDLENALGYLAGDAPGLALETLQSTLARFPDLAIAHAILALAAQRVEEPARAVAELQRASELGPHLSQPHTWLGELYDSNDRPELAAREYAAALEAAPLEPGTLRRLGQLRLDRLGQPSAALVPLREAAALDPTDALLQILVARAELAAGAAPAALSRLDRLVSGHPEEVEVLVGVATVLFDRIGSASQAERSLLTQRVVSLCEKALELQPQTPSASRLLAQARIATPGSHP